MEDIPRHKRDREAPVDIIFTSAELKKLIIQRTEETKIRLVNICQVMNIPWMNFKETYLECENLIANKKFTQEDLIIIARELNIEVRVAIILNPIDPAKKAFYKAQPPQWTEEYRYPRKGT